MVFKKNLSAERICYPAVMILCFIIWLFYLWIFARTPYQLDDWSWGIPYGMEMFLTGGLNGRYVGNLLEIIVSRSPILKAILESLIASFIPFCAVKTALALRCSEKDPCPESRLPQLLAAELIALANILILTIPVSVWRQTYGWIAGFSNYGLASLFLIVYHFLLFSSGFRSKSISVLHYGLLFLFGVCIQLILENVTIYVLGFTVFFVLENWIRTKRLDKILLSLLGGSILGTVVMFSSSIYDSFFHTGQVIGRSLSFNTGDHLYAALPYVYQRFVYYYPNHIWGDNWIICSVISLLGLISVKRFRKWKILYRLFFGGFLLYFPLVHFFGPVENHLHVWNEVYSQYMNLLFFLGMLISLLFLFPYHRRNKMFLVFLWISVPAVIVPLVAVKMIYLRYFLMSSAVLIEFSLCLFALEFDSNSVVIIRFTASTLVLFLFALCVQRTLIYYEIGEGKKEREAQIRSAQNGEINRLFFPDLPHAEYLWYNEPLDGSIQVEYFREFYQIPDHVKMSNSPID